MNKKTVRFGALALLWATCTFAQEQDSIAKVKQLNEVVISDSKFALSKEKSGKVIVKITKEDLEKKAGQSVATVLSSVAGVEVNGNQSGAGKNLGYYIRGGRNRQTLIMIDGIPVTDASGINLEYDLRLIPVDQVESIEIMKGASSTLYGSGAATGVINITLKKAAKKEIAGNAYMSMGTQMTADKVKYNPQDFNQGFAVNGSLDKFNYYATLNSTEIKGISEATVPQSATYEDDRFSRVNSLVKLGFTPTKKLTLDFFGNYDRVKSAFDGSFDNFSNPDSPFNVSTSEQFRFGFSPKYKYNKGEFVLNSAFNTIERNYNIFNSWTSGIDTSDYKSSSVNVDAFNKYEITNQFFVVAGGQFQFHEMNSVTPYDVIKKENAKFNTIDPYLTAVYNSSFGLNINAGARYNMHSVYDNHLVYNINPSYNFSGFPLKVVASYSTAYITPSLYQLYSPYGNLKLTPEENATAEVGFETTLLNKKVTLNAVAFHREEKNSIGFYTDTTTWESYYINVEGKYNAKGVESAVSYSVTDKLKVNANYTFTQPEEKLSRLISKHKGNASVDFHASSRLFLNLNYQYVDDRKDAYFDGGTFATVPVKLDAYQLVNFTVKHELIKNRMSVFGTATNIFNEDFVETVGYSTRGRNFKIGLNLNF
ncbi:tonB-dependent receptor [Flavobacterium cauense R2A-7]|uniref:Vitamin B12 transporter n=1 Tax=Flavobacterium cauense R2A-7 TaxID=1341154 RepID=V6RZ77_9FLAO|nr:TonB-dependent receptor plug domain-containing protein [Flavobacterium cauense]ESU19728.1 tonB-dependent receptor [Flavobacterium cauense R2A-7]KGO79824.1 TonB-dependent receptor [Flavobacterium cauense R2A-7]TWI09211.1 vitamin B12 transporter [Flavobacterium cauense R2A-7]